MVREGRNVADRSNHRIQGLNGDQGRPTLFDRFFDFEAGDRVGFGNVRPDEKQHIGIQDVIEGHGPPMSTLDKLHGVEAVHMPIAGAAVDMVGADGHAEKFLEEVQLFIRTPA